MEEESLVRGKTVKQVRKLNLSGKGLTEIPASIFEYTNITKLVLSRNSIKRIPREIANLKKLEVLDLTYNKIENLPAPVFKLPKLRVLALGHNRIKKFPAQLVGSSIIELIADYNQLELLDPEALNGLSKLIVSNNPIIGQIITHVLPKMEYYDFRNTRLETPLVDFLPNLKKGWPSNSSIKCTHDRVITKTNPIIDIDNKVENASIFISHSSKDKALIDEFVEQVLQLGMGIPYNHIYCTSIDGMGIENGEKMREWIHQHITNCNIAFLMISPNYKNSEICLNEMGAIWALDKKEKILLLPGVDYKTFGWLEEIRQAGRIDDEDVLNKLHDELSEHFGLEKKSAVWGNHKKKFLKYCKGLSPIKVGVSTNPPEREKTDRIYISYCNKIFDLVKYNQYSLWTERVIASRPRIPTAVLEDFDELIAYLDSRAHYAGYERMDELFVSLSLLIDDFTDVFNIYCEGRGEICCIRPFYKEDSHNINYDEDLELYNAYVNIINNMIFELTRVCNAILVEARHLMVDYKPDFGIFSIDGISHKGSVIVKFEYNEGELYKGLKDFIDTAMSRTFHKKFDKQRVLTVLDDIMKEK